MTKIKSIFQLALKNKPWPPKWSGDLRHNQPTASTALSVDSPTFRNEYCSKERLYKISDAPDTKPLLFRETYSKHNCYTSCNKEHESTTMVSPLWQYDKNKFKHSYLTCSRQDPIYFNITFSPGKNIEKKTRKFSVSRHLHPWCS